LDKQLDEPASSSADKVAKKAPPRLRVLLAPKTELQAHKAAFREVFGETLSDEFVDEMLSQLYSALAPGLRPGAPRLSQRLPREATACPNNGEQAATVPRKWWPGPAVPMDDDELCGLSCRDRAGADSLTARSATRVVPWGSVNGGLIGIGGSAQQPPPRTKRGFTT
jgi:hypothetical protein